MNRQEAYELTERGIDKSISISLEKFRNISVDKIVAYSNYGYNKENKIREWINKPRLKRLFGMKY